MTLIDLDSIQFYQAAAKADLAGQRPSMASVGDVPVLCGAGPSSKDPLDLSYKQAPDLNGTGLYAGAASNGLDLSGGRGRGRGEEDKSLPSFEELMLGAGGAQESHLRQSRLRPGGDMGANTDSSSSVHSRSDGTTSKQGERHCSLSTPSTSMAGSETRCSILYEKTEEPISNPPPLPDTLISSAHDTRIYSKNTDPHHSGVGQEKGDKGAIPRDFA